MNREKILFRSTNIEDTLSVYEIIKKSLLTDKTIDLELNKNTICFVVPIWAEKPTIKKALEKIFQVEVLHVNVMNTHGKRKVFNNSKKYFRPAIKKAMVKLTSDSVKKIGRNFNEK